MKTIKFLSLFLIAILFCNCSSDDNTNANQATTATYSTTDLEALFFHPGNSETPTVNWNGNQGTFSLATTLDGLSVNSTTGVLNWTKDLPIGNHTVQVIATNIAGNTTVNLTLNNPLQGRFLGTYTDDTLFIGQGISLGT